MENQFEVLGFKFNPFYSKELKGEWLDLFINREQEIKRTLVYINSAYTTAICSNQGIGKSSFLSYLNEKVLPEKNILSKKFNFDFEKIEENEYIIFLRQLLLELLNLFESVTDRYPKLKTIDYEYEKARLHKTITFEENMKRTFGGKVGLDIDINKLVRLLSPVSVPVFNANMGGDKSTESKVTTQVAVFNTEELKNKIIEIGKLFDEPIVFLIDELDKTGKLFQDNFEWAKQIYLLLRNCREIFESSNFIFIFSLDAVFYNKKIEANIDKTEQNLDLFGIIEEFVLLKRFSFSELKNLVEKRLACAEVKGDLSKFTDDTKLKLLYCFSRGNSRKLMNWYGKALCNACIKEDKTFAIENFFDAFETELNFHFSDDYQKFFMKLAKENQVTVKEFSGLELKPFVKEGYIIIKDGVYSLNLQPPDEITCKLAA